MIELEKKWLVDESKCPLFDIKPDSNHNQILHTTQGYLPFGEEDTWIVRVRRVLLEGSGLPMEWYFLDLKSKGLLAREELSFKITADDFKEHIEKCKGNIVEKIRYRQFNGTYWLEVDKYKDHDFVTCEVEFPNMKEANNFEEPDWFLEEVTFDPKYKNMNLGV